jgi:hypothetical protein
MVELTAYGQNGEEFDLSFIDEIPISINYLISDIRNPDKRNSTYSKTINLPSTSEVNQMFENIFETNINIQYFNPNKKLKIIYRINGIDVINGTLQLIKITMNDLSGYGIYEVAIVGRLGELFDAVVGKTFNDLDFGEYNHLLTKQNVKDSWANKIKINGTTTQVSNGVGYVYPLIDYGFNNGNVFDFYVKHFRPAIFKWTIWNKIFEIAGKTYTSNFINSAYYKSQIIPYSEAELKITDNDIANAQFISTLTAPQINSYAMGLQSITNVWVSPTNTLVIFNDDANLPNNDAGNQYNVTSGVFTCAVTNNYYMGTTVSVQIEVVSATAITMSITGGVTCYLQEYNTTTNIWDPIGGTVANFQGSYNSLITTPISINANNAGNTLTAGKQYRVVLTSPNLKITLLDSANNQILTGSHSLKVTAGAGSIFYSQLVTPQIIEGANVDVNKWIPKDLKIIDWLMNEFRMFNLYMEVDKLNENNFIIEDRDSFYSGAVLDWTGKRDLSQKRIISPMGELDWLNYTFTYKIDSDDKNTTYMNKFKEVYGTKNLTIENDFIKSTKKVELLYSATPISGSPNNEGLVIPRLYKTENGTIKNIKTNIRCLLWGGMVTMPSGNWILKSNSGDETLMSYPYAGDGNHPFNPTETLNWDTPKEVYYIYPLATYTTNNLFNKFYSRQIRQTSDKNSKIEKRHYYLDEIDISKFDFRVTIFDDGSYFYVNKIIDYNPLKNQSTQVELIKLIDVPFFNGGIIPPPNVNAVTFNQRPNGGLYLDEYGNVNFGRGNSKINGGKNNFIPSDAVDVVLNNCNNYIVPSGTVNSIIDNNNNNNTN